MAASEALSAPVAMPGHYSASRVSAAAGNCRLYIAHRAGDGTADVYNFNDGNGWSYDRYIPAGPGGANLTSSEPVIAERSGYLHLVHREGENLDGRLMWTYFDGASWALELSIGSARTTYRPGLTAGGSGLVAVATTYYDSPASSLEYAQALPPYQYPCVILTPLGADSDEQSSRANHLRDLTSRHRMGLRLLRRQDGLLVRRRDTSHDGGRPRDGDFHRCRVVKPVGAPPP